MNHKREDMQERKYLKNVLPRLYEETKEWLETLEDDYLAEQLPHLFITRRCTCGDCSDFSMDSDLPHLSLEAGSKLLQRPLYYEMPNGFSLGLSGKSGLTVGEHHESYVSSFELCGADYPDRYIHNQLEAHGFTSTREGKET